MCWRHDCLVIVNVSAIHFDVSRASDTRGRCVKIVVFIVIYKIDSDRQTQIQTTFIQQKQMQIPQHVDISFIHITNNYDT